MNELKVFNNEQFGNLRVILIDGKEWFVASEVAKSLGYTNPNKAIIDHCKSITKRYIPHPQSELKTIQVNFIPESDIYRLIINSKLPSAEKFERWVFDEVLPSVRKHGAYITTNKIEEIMANPESWIKMLTALKDERDKRLEAEQQNQILAPKAMIADTMLGCDNSILIGQLAKIICNSGYDIGEKRLFEWLRQNGYLHTSGTTRNNPTQRSIELGIMELQERVVDKNNFKKLTFTTKITPKGQQYFIKKFANLQK